MTPHPRRRSHRARLLAVATFLLLGVGRAHADALYTVTDLGPLDVATGGDDLNNSGDVAGTLGGPNGTPLLYHSYGPDAGTFADLSGVLGGHVPVAGLTDSGQVFTTNQYPYGYLPYPIPAATLEAFRRAVASAGYADAQAFGVNASGQLVGMALVGSYPTAALHAFLYEDGTLKDLNDLVPSLPSHVLEAATAINNNGQILVSVVVPGTAGDTLLLTPAGEPAPAPPPAPAVPEPSILAFFSLAAAGVAVRRAWARRRA